MNNEYSYDEGFFAKSICDNPYWKNYPKPSSEGVEDERNARAFVDGYVFQIRVKNRMLIEDKA